MTGYAVTGRARRDLTDIDRYVGGVSPAAAARLLDRFQATFEMLGRMPGAGRSRDEWVRGSRSFPVGEYLIMYRQVGEGVEILRVLHGRRNLSRILGEKR